MTPRVPIGNVVDLIRGVTFKPDDVSLRLSIDSVVCMRTKNIQQELDETDLIMIPQRFVKRREQFLQSGDVLISSANSANLVGKAVFLPSLSYRATAGGFISILRANTDALCPRYFFHWLVSSRTQALVRQCSRQTTNIANLSTQHFLQLEIPLHPRKQQTRIAAILDKADSILLKRVQAIRLADSFLRAVFLKMFGDPVTNPKGWLVGTVRDLVSSANYGTSKKAHKTKGNFPILRMNNLTYSGRMDLSSVKYVDLDPSEEPKYLARRGDLLFNRTNSKELVGKTAVYERDEPMAIAGYLVRVRTNERGNPHYLSAYLNSAHGKQVLQSMCKSIIGMANINAQDLQNIQIMMPPRAVQDRYAEIVERTREFENRLTASLEQLESIKASLSHRLFC